MMTRVWWVSFLVDLAAVAFIFGILKLEEMIVMSTNNESTVVITIFVGTTIACLAAIGVFGLTVWLIATAFSSQGSGNS